MTTVWLLGGPAANAQAQGSSPVPSEQPAQQQPTQPSPDISDEKLDATAAALQRVASVRKDYQQRIKAASEADGQRIAEEGKGALVKAITDQGISVEEYVAILVVAQNDPAVRERIVRRIRPSPE